MPQYGESGQIYFNMNLYVCIYIYMYTFWVFNIAMENGPFIKDLPIKDGVCIYIYTPYNIIYTLWTGSLWEDLQESHAFLVFFS